MHNINNPTQNRIILVTGAAQRVGATIVRTLHAAGMNIVLHYRNSNAAACALQEELHQIRANSVALVQGDLLDAHTFPQLVEAALEPWGRLDGLINNASTFYPTPVGTITEEHWMDLMGSNLKAPLFLMQAIAPHLKTTGGAIVNLVDIHAEKPLKAHPVYSAAKAGLAMLTKSMARELGPEVRVNGVAPGAILWPEQGMPEEIKTQIVEKTALKRTGDPSHIAETVLFLLRDADYITGQIIAVDGGRSLSH